MWAIGPGGCMGMTTTRLRRSIARAGNNMARALTPRMSPTRGDGGAAVVEQDRRGGQRGRECGHHAFIGRSRTQHNEMALNGIYYTLASWLHVEQIYIPNIGGKQYRMSVGYQALHVLSQRLSAASNSTVGNEACDEGKRAVVRLQPDSKSEAWVWTSSTRCCT